MWLYLEYIARYEDAPCITKNLAGFSMILHNSPYRNAKGLIASWMFFLGYFSSRYLGPWTEMPWNKQRPCWKKKLIFQSLNLPIPMSLVQTDGFRKGTGKATVFFWLDYTHQNYPQCRTNINLFCFVFCFLVGTLHLYLEVWKTRNNCYQQGLPPQSSQQMYFHHFDLV